MAFNPISFAMGRKSAEGGGGDIATQPLNVSENGTYTAPSGKAYTPVNVAVPGPDEYSGSYEATSAVGADTTIPTQGKLMTDDFTVKQIPYQETSNLSGGYTVTIGG